MKADSTRARGWIAGTRYVADLEAHSARPLPVMEAPGCTAELLTVPGDAFEPPAAAPVGMRREGREVYALRETAEEASERLAAYYNAQIARRKGAELVQIQPRRAT
jgi:hypothetical protein